MPWTTGSVNKFANTATEKGILGKLLEWLAPSRHEESIGTGNGVATSFPIALANTGVAVGQLRMTYKIGGTILEAWENGEGKFVGSQVNASSSIDRATGIGTFITDNPVDDGYAIMALYSTALVEGLDWLVLHQGTTKNNSGVECFPGEYDQEVILRNSGIGHKDNICVGLRETHYVSQQFWAWNLNGGPIFLPTATSWNAQSSFHSRTTYDATWQMYTTQPTIYFKDDTMQYWFVANKRRIIVIVRVTNTIYASCFLGFGSRLSTEKENQCPLFVGGNYFGKVNFSSSSLNGLNHAFAITGNSGIVALNDKTYASPSNCKLSCTTSSLTNVIKKSSTDKVVLQPFGVGYQDGSGITYAKNLYDLDGVFLALCDALSAEDIISDSGIDYLVVPNVYRTSFSDYFCVRLD